MKEKYLIWIIIFLKLTVFSAINMTFEEHLEEAKKGNSYSQWWTGYAYENGLGVEKNYKEAFLWYRQAAESGKNHPAVRMFYDRLGVCYEEGIGVPQSLKEAAKWYTLSAEKGSTAAQLKLSSMYFQGAGVPKDNEKGQKYLWMAAAGQHPNSDPRATAVAQRILGLKHYFGENGFLQDYKFAAVCFWKAMKSGDVDACALLAMCYGSGNGVSKDMALAYVFSNIALSVKLENESAREPLEELRSDFMQELTPAQISAAQEVARDYRKKYFSESP
ncbi:MAG: tetratricopeptide repeat protein [Kiritimatiellales bacterium]